MMIEINDSARSLFKLLEMLIKSNVHKVYDIELMTLL
jgi:hypothetical protein